MEDRSEVKPRWIFDPDSDRIDLWSSRGRTASIFVRADYFVLATSDSEQIGGAESFGHFVEAAERLVAPMHCTGLRQARMALGCALAARALKMQALAHAIGTTISYSAVRE